MERAWAGRVYYDCARIALTLLLAVGLDTSRAHAQVDLSVHPSMVKGPPTAPVTIVEFSDYQ